MCMASFPFPVHVILVTVRDAIPLSVHGEHQHWLLVAQLWDTELTYSCVYVCVCVGGGGAVVHRLPFAKEIHISETHCVHFHGD